MEGRNTTTHRQECLDQSVLLFTLGIIWLFSATIGLTKFTNFAILIYIAGNTLIAPLVSGIRQLTGIKHPVTEKAAMALSCLTMGIILGLLVTFFPFIENPVVFLPAFCLIQGVFFALIGQITDNKTYWSVALALIFTGLYSWFNYMQTFHVAGMIAAAINLSFGIFIRISAEISKISILTSRAAKSVQLGKVKAIKN